MRENDSWYFNYVLKQTRRIFSWSPERRKARLLAAGASYGMFLCASCQKEHPRAETFVDHIKPVIAIETGFTDWNSYFERLYCSVDNLQVLCGPCHKAKSKAENELRRKYRANIAKRKGREIL